MFLLTWLTSCAWLAKPEGFGSADYLPLAPPAKPSRRVVQQIKADWGKHQETFLCVLELDQRQIAVAGLTQDGMSLFNLSYNGKQLVMDKTPLLPDYVVPEQIIKDLQLAFWNEATLKPLLPAHWRLEAGSLHRKLYFNDDLRVDVDYIQPDAQWPKTVVLTNHHYHYRLQISTISYEALPE